MLSLATNQKQSFNESKNTYDVIKHCESLIASVQHDIQPFKNKLSGDGSIVNYGKRFGIDVSVNISDILKRIEDTEALLKTFEDGYLLFGNSEGKAVQDDELSWDNIDKILNTKKITLNTGGTIDEFSTDVLMADDSDTAVPTEHVVKTYADVIEASAVLIDGTRELTANWDAGSYKITAESFESDVATGTAPFTVASTTLNTNLNADMVDGYHHDQSLLVAGSPTFAGLTVTPGNIIVDTGYIDSKTVYKIDDSTVLSIDGTNNIMVGVNTGNEGFSTNGVFIGANAGSVNEGINNTFIGSESGQYNISGHANLFIGTGSGQNNMTGHSNVFFGSSCGLDNISGSRNVFIGISAGENSLSSYNVGIGGSSLFSQNTSGAYHNVGIGYSALWGNVSGYKNTAVGGKAMFGVTSALHCTAVGYGALYGAAGNSCTAIGYYTLYSATGLRSTSVGKESYRYNVSGSDLIGLGYRAGYHETGSDKLYIDNRDRSNEATARISSLVYGVLSATVADQVIRFNASVELYQDNLYMKWGSGGDSGIKDSGSNLIFNADINSVGSREFKFQNGVLTNEDGRKVNKTRVTSNTLLDSTNHVVLCDTDGGNITITYPAGSDSTLYTIKNCGSSGNIVTITPNGSETVDNNTVSDGECYQQVYDTTEGWVTI